MERSPIVQKVLDSMAVTLRGKTIDQAQVTARCHNCKGTATEFRDAVSRREYSISGLCQKCQDIMFGSEEDE